MRRYKYIGVIFLVFLYGTAYAQFFKGFIAAGANLAQVDGDEAYGYKMPGANFSLGVMIPLGGNFDVSMETGFTQKGANQKAQYIAFRGDDTLTGAYKLRLDYVSIPLMVQYTDKDFVSVGLGFAYSRLVGASEFEHGKQTPTTALNGVYKPNDYGVLLDLRMKIKHGLKFNFRYEYSMARIRTREFSTIGGTQSWTRHQFNNTISFRLLYVFNEQRSERIRKELTAPQ